MASPQYNNKTVAEQEARRKLGISFAPPENGPNADEADFPDEKDALLDGARGALGRANDLSASSGLDSINQDTSQKLAALSKPQKGVVRSITEPLNTVGNAAVIASLPAMLAGPEVSGPLGTAGGALMVPDYLRRLISPDADETRPGVGESLGTALMALPALSSLRGLKSAATAATDTDALSSAWKAAEEIPYRAGGSAADVQRPLQQRANSILRSTPITAPAVEKPLSPIEQFYKNDPQARIGGEGRMTGQFEEGEGGLSSIGNMMPYANPTDVLAKLANLSGKSKPAVQTVKKAIPAVRDSTGILDRRKADIVNNELRHMKLKGLLSSMRTEQ